MAHVHELLTRIRNARHARITYQHDICAFLELCYESLRLLDLIELMIARHRRLYLKMIQELYAVSGIFRRYQICLFQDTDGPKSHIFQIPDRSSAQIQDPRHMQPFPAPRGTDMV